MAYIIENIHLLKKGKVKETSILVNGNRIEAIKNSFLRYQYVRMDGSPYIMTPTPILYDNQVALHFSCKEQKHYMEENLIKRGCTMFLTCCTVNKEQELANGIKKVRHQLINSAIDYVICVKIPLKKLSSSFIRATKKEKIPAIFVEIEEAKEIYSKQWGWIKEALFPYNSPLVPVFLMDNQQERKKAQLIWATMMRDVKMPSLIYELKEGEPISFQDLVKIGLYPFNGNIYHGGEVTYNLYEYNPSIINIDESHLYLYHNNRIQMTVHKGFCIRAGDKVYYRPGFGEQIEVNVPSFLKFGGD